jgi:hypothetical protein
MVKVIGARQTPKHGQVDFKHVSSKKCHFVHGIFYIKIIVYRIRKIIDPKGDTNKCRCMTFNIVIHLRDFRFGSVKMNDLSHDLFYTDNSVSKPQRFSVSDSEKFSMLSLLRC